MPMDSHLVWLHFAFHFFSLMFEVFTYFKYDHKLYDEYPFLYFSVNLIDLFRLLSDVYLGITSSCCYVLDYGYIDVYLI